MEALDCLYHNKKAHGFRERLTFFCDIARKLSRFPRTKKSKNASKLCLKNYLISLFLFCFSYYLSFDFQSAKIRLISGLPKKKERSPPEGAPLSANTWEFTRSPGHFFRKRTAITPFASLTSFGSGRVVVSHWRQWPSQGLRCNPANAICRGRSSAGCCSL